MIRKSFVIRTPEAWKSFTAFFRANWREDRPLAVIVTEPQAQRTIEQNRTLHFVLREIAAEAFVDGKQFPVYVWKEHYRRMFLGHDEIVLPTGEVVERHRSTADLSVAEMADFINRIIENASSELGVDVSVR